MISAKIIADSLNTHGQRLTTFVLTFPRIVLAEFNTHRMFSRNSASSRAIPFKKMLKMVRENPFIPIRWMKDHTGMQGNEYYTGTVKSWVLRNLWLSARNFAVIFAWLLSKAGLSKQFVNRLLEPFIWHTVIVTASEWENFFALRADAPAEIHIQELAYQMLNEYNYSIPVQLKEGEWHMPFGDNIFMDRLLRLINSKFEKIPFQDPDNIDLDSYYLKISTARCARVSYGNFEGSDNYEADIKLHDRLAKSGHWSPFEHCARAMTATEYFSHVKGHYESGKGVEKDFNGWSGNFRGFIQYRKTFANENKTDKRVKK